MPSHIIAMTQILKSSPKLILVAGLLALSSPSLADETDPNIKDGTDMMSRGFQMLMEGLAQEMAPMAEDLANQMQEGWAQLHREMGDISAYHPPEVLPNGDIIIRRKTPDPVRPSDEEPPKGQTDL